MARNRIQNRRLLRFSRLASSAKKLSALGSVGTMQSQAFGIATYTDGLGSNFAYLTGFGSTLIDQIDITNPASMSLTGTQIPTNSAVSLGVTTQINPAYLYAQGPGMIQSLDIHNQVSVFDNGTSGFAPWPFASYNNQLYFATEDQGSAAGDSVDQYDYTNPAGPTLVSSYNFGTFTNDVFTVCFDPVTSYVYVTQPTSGVVSVLDFSVAGAPTLVSTTAPLLAQANGIFKRGNFLYVSCFPNPSFPEGIQTLDATTTPPTVVNTISFSTDYSPLVMYPIGANHFVVNCNVAGVVLIYGYDSHQFPKLVAICDPGLGAGNQKTLATSLLGNYLFLAEFNTSRVFSFDVTAYTN